MRQHIPAFNQLQINLSANDCNAAVTPFRKAASYDQRKTNLGNQNFRRRIIT